jgi:DNA-binding Lrp family transcriptional regulator
VFFLILLIIVMTIQNCNHQRMSDKFTVTDYQIIKQLVYNPRMEISEIGRAISTSPKTARRRLEKMHERNHMRIYNAS